jgi:hypothetical protein
MTAAGSTAAAAAQTVESAGIAEAGVQTLASSAPLFQPEHGGTLGYLVWAVWQLVAALVSIPLAVFLLVKFMCK